MHFFHSLSIYWEKWSYLNQPSPGTEGAGGRQRRGGRVLATEWPHVRGSILPPLEPHSALVAAFWGATALWSLGRGVPTVTCRRQGSVPRAWINRHSVNVPWVAWMKPIGGASLFWTCFPSVKWACWRQWDDACEWTFWTLKHWTDRCQGWD